MSAIGTFFVDSSLPSACHSFCIHRPIYCLLIHYLLFIHVEVL
uniref:Uncharacterized protein n=1 Tax=Siphoviridae sp. ctOCb13 TaxID=2825477 RepID=A0A8S5Q1M2_9CAUD|nr:MAG TPA: hypothetical protein [Siphoviridae sp. ctOCb13]